MFEPEKLPAPDEAGFFFHPDIPGESEDDDVSQLCREQGYEAAAVSMDADAPDLADCYFENEDGDAVNRWQPTGPVGGGWQIVAKYDTEDGPCAMFVRPICVPANKKQNP
jgi:hypothetical protein